MQLQHIMLEDRFVRLEPLDDAHREGLRAACAADETVWRDLYPVSWAPAEFDASWATFAGENAAGRVITFAVIAGGLCVGMSSYMNIAPNNATVEIGATYYRPDARGGPVNPAAKRLLLGSAFEAGARRVQLNVDAITLHSRAAVLKLGAVQEGILRRDRITWTGRIRDTVIFSILDDEWPAVRERLDARLAAFGAG
jgi:RimJ/RimL family protein N-acetyltransferase